MVSSDGDGEMCWICLEEAAEDGSHALMAPCKCPRKVHPQCLARWQLQQAGRHEEKFCRFCNNELADWKLHLTPEGLRPEVSKVQPIMVVYFEGQIHRIPVKQGPDGLDEFTGRIRELFRLPDDVDISLTFGCKEPMSGTHLKLEGVGAFDAAVHCASVAAAERQQKVKRSCSAGALGARPEGAAGAVAAGGGGGGSGARPSSAAPGARGAAAAASTAAPAPQQQQQQAGAGVPPSASGGQSQDRRRRFLEQLQQPAPPLQQQRRGGGGGGSSSGRSRSFSSFTAAAAAAGSTGAGAAGGQPQQLQPPASFRHILGALNGGGGATGQQPAAGAQAPALLSAAAVNGGGGSSSSSPVARSLAAADDGGSGGAASPSPPSSPEASAGLGIAASAAARLKRERLSLRNLAQLTDVPEADETVAVGTLSGKFRLTLRAFSRKVARSLSFTSSTGSQGGGRAASPDHGPLSARSAASVTSAAVPAAS